MKKILISSLFFSSMIMGMENNPPVTMVTNSAEKTSKTMFAINALKKFGDSLSERLLLQRDQTPPQLSAHNVPRRLPSWRTTSFPAISLKDLLGNNDEVREEIKEDASERNIDAPTETQLITMNCNIVIPWTILFSLVTYGLIYQMNHLG